MTMTAQELIEILEGMDPDAEVRFASQPSWPFEYSISAAAEVDGVLYLAEGTQLGYLPGEVAEQIGWA
jgi:heme oxygenase